MTATRILCALFVAYVAATALHIGYILAHEPFSFDAWNVAVDTGAEPFTPARFFGYWWHQYTHSNPRLGQALTYLTYKLDLVAEVMMPLSFLAISLAVTALGLGRWPWRRARDLAIWAIAIGFAWFALPDIGRNLFCRAYAANYVFGAAVQLWFLVPLRLARSYEVSPLQVVAYAGAGVIAGLCNEHTGPALVTFLFGYAWWLHRTGERPKLVWAGALGAAAGFAAIFFAPGQGERYDGLAQHVSLPMRMIQRGITGNLDIFRDYVLYAAPVLGLIVIVLIAAFVRPTADEAQRAAQRRALGLIALVLAAGCVLAATLFVSPKLGARFYIVSMALLLVGFLALLDSVVTRPRQLAPFVALAIFASLYAGMRTVPLFTRVSAQGATRMTALAASPPGALFVADAFAQVDESWWFIGDDFRDFQKRELVANYFGLGRVFFRGYAPKAPLGLLGVKLFPRYTTTSGVTDTYDHFDLGDTKGFDLPGAHRSVKAAIELLGRQIAPDQLATFELEVEFIGARPPLPRPHLIVARYANGRLVGHAAKIARRGGSTTRELRLPANLASTALEIYVLQVGGEVRRLGTAADGVVSYVPWTGGVYWALACDADECWVIAATRHGA